MKYDDKDNNTNTTSNDDNDRDYIDTSLPDSQSNGNPLGTETK